MIEYYIVDSIECKQFVSLSFDDDSWWLCDFVGGFFLILHLNFFVTLCVECTGIFHCEMFESTRKIFS